MGDLTTFHRPIAFQTAARTVHPPSWLDFTPFAFWLVDALRPRRFVELGCHTGNSYSSFAQGVQALGLTTACYGVDTWEGDPHAGPIDAKAVLEWMDDHDRRFGSFSRLIKSTFDDALPHFADGSIDLLHIDGYHTYEAVAHDFEAWRPKVSDRGVVLLHDIGVRQQDFGVWRLWEELSGRYPSFEFRHGHGLGVLAVGPDAANDVRHLVSLEPADRDLVRQFFARLGAAILHEYADAERDCLRTQNRELRETVHAMDQLRVAQGEEIDTLRCMLNVRRRDRSRATVVVVSHVGARHPRAGNEYRLNRMLRWYVRNGYRVIPIIAPLPGEELSAEAIAGTAAEFGNAIQVHRDGRIDHDLRDAPAGLDMDAVPAGGTVPAIGNGIPPEQNGELDRIDRTFCHDAVIAAARHVEQALGPHILQVEYIWMTRFLPVVRRDVLKVIDTVDVFSSIDMKVRQFGLSDLAVDAQAEAIRLRRADLVIAIQAEEHQALERLAGQVPVVTAGIDFDVTGDPGGAVPGRILYLASGNPRNRKGLMDFLGLAWSRIRRAVPDAELVVAGAVAATVADRRPPGVRLLGAVDDVAPLYREAALVINPVVAGTGVKVKTLEALCHLRRIVTWPAGVDGLDAELAARCIVAHDWYEFANLAVDALSRRDCPTLTEEDGGVIAAILSPERAYADVTRTFDEFFTRHGLVRTTRIREPMVIAGVAAHAD
jgi:hypothetical protein